MNRQEAIAKAKYFRISHIILDAKTAKEVFVGRGPIVTSEARTIEVEKDGKKHSKVIYKRRVTEGYSIALAKKHSRTLSKMVAQQPGENLRAIAQINVAKAEEGIK